MADPANPVDGLSDPSTLERIKQILSQINEIVNKLSVNGSKAGGLLISIGQSVDKLNPAMQNVVENAGNIFDTIVSGAEDGIESLKRLGKESLGLDFGDLGSGDVDNAFKGLLRSVKSGTDGIKQTLSENRVNIAEMITFKVSAGIYDKMLAPVIELEEHMTDRIKKVTPSLVDLGGGFKEAGIDADTFKNQASLAITEVGHSAYEMGVAVQEAQDGFRGLADAGMYSAEIFGKDITQGTSAASGGITNLTAAMRFASATGMNMTTVGKYMQQNIRSLGREMSDTGMMFSALSLAQRDTNLSMSSVSSTVMESANGLKYYGTSVESLSNTFNAFVTTVGKGKQELGKALFTDTVGQLNSMNFGLKAFLGMQSQLGQGRGAIGAGLEFEEALAEGRTGEIFTSIREQMERLGGGEVLTRKGALDTGQETQYLMQRQLLSTLTGQADAGKLDTMMGIIQRQEIERATEVFAPPRAMEAQEEGLLKLGQTRMDMETGVFAQGLNKLRAKEEEAIGKMITAYSDSAEALRGITTSIGESIEVLGRGAGSMVQPEAATWDGEDGAQAAKNRAASAVQLARGEAQAAAGEATETQRVAEMGARFSPETAHNVELDPRLRFESQNQIRRDIHLGRNTQRGAESGLQLNQETRRMIDQAPSRLSNPPNFMLQEPALRLPVQGPIFNTPTGPTPIAPGAAIPNATPTPGDQSKPPTTGKPLMQFDAQPLEIPIIIKLDGDSLKVSLASYVDKRITAKVTEAVVG